MAHGTARIGKDRYRTEIDVGPHHLVADEPPALGGQAVGPAPYDLLLAGLAACTAITLRMYADRKGWPLASVEVGMRLTGGAGAVPIDRTLTIAGIRAEPSPRPAHLATTPPAPPT